MPITFDTQQELMAFMRTFQVKEGTKTPALKTAKGKPGPKPKAAKTPAPLEQPEKAKRGRKPKAAQSKVTGSDKKASTKTQGKRGPKPKLKATAKQAKPAKTVKAAKPKANSNRGALSQGIIQTIEQFMADKQGFTCNDIFQKLAESLPKAAKQSVVSAASSILKKQYGHLHTDSRPGAGPRPEKVYLPE